MTGLFVHERQLRPAAGIRVGKSVGAAYPATTSSPCALIRNSPLNWFRRCRHHARSRRLSGTVFTGLPNTMVCTFTAVPQEAGMSFNSRYTCARSLFQLSNTAKTAPQLLPGIAGKITPRRARIRAYLETLHQFLLRSSVLSSVSSVTHAAA